MAHRYRYPLALNWVLTSALRDVHWDEMVAMMQPLAHNYLLIKEKGYSRWQNEMISLETEAELVENIK